MKRLLSMAVLSIFLLASCSSKNEEAKSEKNHIPSQNEVSFSHNGQDFKIIPFYEEILDYTGYVKENPSESNPGAYVEKVLDPIKEKSAMDYLTLDYPFNSSTEIDQLEDNTIKLLQNQDQINELIKEALIKSSELLPGGDKNIYVMPLRPEDNFVIEKMEGVFGVVYNDNAIFIQLDTSFSEKLLKYTVAHEYHHTINIQINRDMAYHTVLDSIITEGKADSFAGIVYPEISAPWTESLPDETEELVLEELSEYADSTSIKIYNDFFKGKSSKGIPLWTNYKIGYQITQSYIEHNPEMPISKWTSLLTKDLLQDSEYNNLLQ
ncbi:DUF2268 domain-containing protein [Paenisporosarcina indica]|uniref:DUF2268 domain-containing protein n=1 Tax=Paenisporosarcina indica TaxID=650093 RepID=UPI00094F8B8E|nr:DUF2268 domain-containing putative Zn-dependent protease [Paenisporosarcina indica]